MNPSKYTDPMLSHLLRTTSRFALSIDGEGGGEAGGGTNGGGGGGGSTTGSEGGSAAPGPDWGAFMQSLESMNNGNGVLAGKMDALIDTVKAATPPEPEPEPVDFDAMTPRELAEHVTRNLHGSLRDEINKAMEPIVAAVNSLQTNVSAKSVNEDIMALKSKAKDFDDWKGDMAALAKEHQTLSIPQLYALAKGLNPEKVAALDKKYNPPAPPKPKWGGLTPFGGSTGADGDGKAEKLSGREATMAALDEVTERHPVLAALMNS